MMVRHFKFAAALACLTLVVAPTASVAALQSANDDYLYEYRYFSDATHSEQVGYAVDGCNGFAQIDGQQTQYFTQTIIGYRQGPQCIYL